MIPCRIIAIDNCFVGCQSSDTVQYHSGRPLFCASLLCNAFIAAVVSGCAPLPRVAPSPQLRDTATLASAKSFAAPTTAWPTDEWWTQFNSPILNALITEALKNAPDVAAATARIRAADALAQQAAVATGPLVSASTRIGGSKQSENLGIPPAFVPKGINETGSVAAQLDFDLDLWGKNRAALSAARGEAEAARIDQEQAILLLTTGVGTALADLDRFHIARAVAADALDVRMRTAKLTAERVAAGVDNQGAIAAADARVPLARAQLTALDEGIAITKNRIAALVGAGPDRGQSVAAPSMTPLTDGIPADAGVALIGRRPDIAAARIRAEAAADRIKVARASFYPNISLNLLAGVQSLGLDRLVTSGSTNGNGGLAITLPIFATAPLQARYRGARADYELAVARYDATLISALREVADVIASRRSVAEQSRALHTSVDSAQNARRIATLRYRGGLSSQFAVLQADDILVEVRRLLAENESRRIALDIALVRALGGGFTAPARAVTSRPAQGTY